MYETLIINLAGGRLRFERLDGRDHLVVPTVLIKEGVLNGSGGPLLYRASDLAPTPQLWNNIPLLLGHPSGGRIAAAVLSTHKLGVVRNVSWQPPRLLGEAWLDIARVNVLDKRIVDNLRAGKSVEVSTGLWTENIPQSGTFNGTAYNFIATNHRPDHLAVLPDQIGACSCRDGCGAGVSVLNSSQQKAFIMNDLEELQAIRNRLSEKVLANPRNTFTREWLDTVPLKQLEGLASLTPAKPPTPLASYYGQQGVHTLNSESKPPELPLHLPTLNGAFKNPLDPRDQQGQQTTNRQAVAVPTMAGLPTLDGCFKNPLANR